MQIKEKILEDVAVITLKGQLRGGDDTVKLKDKVHSLVGDNMKKVVMDLGGVNFIDSSGIGTLIATLTTMKNAGGDLRLAAIDKNISSLLAMMQLLKVFDTYETVDRAVASYRTTKK